MSHYGHHYYKRRKIWIKGKDCHYCGRPATTIDHHIPVSQGIDPLDETNWLPACGPCNSSKGNRDAPSLHRVLSRRGHSVTGSSLFSAPRGEGGQEGAVRGPWLALWGDLG